MLTNAFCLKVFNDKGKGKARVYALSTEDYNAEIREKMMVVKHRIEMQEIHTEQLVHEARETSRLWEEIFVMLPY